MNKNSKSPPTPQHRAITTTLERCLRQATAIAMAQRARLDAAVAIHPTKSGEQP